MSGKLYVVGTPIGNLEDLSFRAARILGEVDFIAAEDTRVTLKLLNRYNIKKPMVSYFEHNKFTRGEEILGRVKSGETCALVTDAGMPAISDPGEDLVREARACGIEIESVPGPSAVTAALSLSGMSTARFCFEGFLPADKKQRGERLLSLKGETRTMVFYEAPHRLLKTLGEMLAVFGDRQAAVCKEITKAFENVDRTSLLEAVNRYNEKTVRGEYVIIVSGASPDAAEYTFEDAVSLCRELTEKGEKTAAASAAAAKITGFKKSDIYKALIDEKTRKEKVQE